MKRKTTTSTEVKQRWEKDNYKRYVLRLRKDTDADLINLIESTKAQHGTGTSETIKELLRG